MRSLLLPACLLAALSIGCESKPPVGPGKVTITETTTSTSTTTTTTIPVLPEALFEFSPLTPKALQVVQFNDAGSKPGTGGNSIVSYSWDFGDGVMKTGVTATHDFFPDGTYLVTLTVIDDNGGKGTLSKPVTVRPEVP
jgi:PKD repeat protein